MGAEVVLGAYTGQGTIRMIWNGGMYCMGCRIDEDMHE
jgi:hypothetical protein